MSIVERETRYILYGAGNLGKSLLWASADFTLLFVLTAPLCAAAVDAG